MNSIVLNCSEEDFELIVEKAKEYGNIKQINWPYQAFDFAIDNQIKIVYESNEDAINALQMFEDKSEIGFYINLDEVSIMEAGLSSNQLSKLSIENLYIAFGSLSPEKLDVLDFFLGFPNFSYTQTFYDILDENADLVLSDLHEHLARIKINGSICINCRSDITFDFFKNIDAIPNENWSICSKSTNFSQKITQNIFECILKLAGKRINIVFRDLNFAYWPGFSIVVKFFNFNKQFFIYALYAARILKIEHWWFHFEKAVDLADLTKVIPQSSCVACNIMIKEFFVIDEGSNDGKDSVMAVLKKRTEIAKSLKFKIDTGDIIEFVVSCKKKEFGSIISEILICGGKPNEVSSVTFSFKFRGYKSYNIM
ncbi:unnamed protein product [Blepharisma stoltei]|uniref:Uncharacterized protein n=1 Tax=Blepharisma stoltei TaxID=1481888 RepID=A0AAU9K2I6_9CILI|nr:unnamed protein product [Blepharisma stoltei]